MSTVRVYELAKELNVSNKEVLDFLKSKNIDLTSHMSNVEDEHVRMVRENFKKGNVSAQSSGAGKQGEGDRPKKKFIQVFRPQNASHMPERKQKPRQNARPGQEQRGDNRRQENRQGESRGTAGSMRQENRNNRPGGRPNGDNRQNRQANSGENRPQGRFHNNNGEGRFNNRNNNGEGRQQGRFGGNRITQTTGVRIARTGRMAETTVYRAVLIMEKIVLVFPARTVHRAALEERMKVEEIPEENREASLKARIWNL